MTTFSERISIQADKGRVWDALADIGSIHRWNPGVADSRTTTEGEVGLGSERRCDLDKKIYLNEKIVEWIHGEILTMRIIETNLPFKSADIKFSLEQRGTETLVTVSPKYFLKFGLLGRLMDVLFVRSQYRKGMANLLKGLKQYVDQGTDK